MHPPRPARRPRALPILAPLLASALVTLAPLTARAQPQPSAPSDPVAALPPELRAGAEAYLANWCGGCHALGALGTQGAFGPPHDAAGVVAAARVLDPGYRGAATDAASYLRESLVAPEAHVVPGFGLARHRMPSYASLEPERIDALVAFLAALPLPAPTPPAGSGSASGSAEAP